MYMYVCMDCSFDEELTSAFALFQHEHQMANNTPSGGGTPHAFSELYFLYYVVEKKNQFGTNGETHIQRDAGITMQFSSFAIFKWAHQNRIIIFVLNLLEL